MYLVPVDDTTEYPPVMIPSPIRHHITKSMSGQITLVLYHALTTPRQASWCHRRVLDNVRLTVAVRSPEVPVALALVRAVLFTVPTSGQTANIQTEHTSFML